MNLFNYKTSKIIITGGHLTPAIAVLNELKKRGYNNKVLWVGHKYNQAGAKELSAEYKTVQNYNIDFVELKTGKLIRKWSSSTFLYGLKQFFYIFSGFAKSLYIILKYRPKIVISFGGYLALPIVIIGKFFGCKVVTHEQTIVAGLANKIISVFANKVFISWESSKKFFNSNKVVLTGNPIRRNIFSVKSHNLTEDFNKDLPIIYITGGNQGANEINKRIFKILNLLLEDCNIIHQTGNSTTTQDYQMALGIQKNLSAHLRYRYVVKDYILEDEIGEAMQKADLIFSRAGANTISEILALGKLCVLMPIPWVSFNEQTLNAELVVSTGLGFIVMQKDSLTAETIYQTLLLGLNHYKKNIGFNDKNLDLCKQISSKLILLDAPQIFVDELEKL